MAERKYRKRERKKESKKERKKERKNERKKESKKERKKGRKNERKKERKKDLKSFLGIQRLSISFLLSLTSYWENATTEKKRFFSAAVDEFFPHLTHQKTSFSNRI